METNTNLSLSLIAAGDTDISSMPALIRDTVALMRDSGETVNAKTNTGRMFGGAALSIAKSGRKADRIMGVLLSSAESSGDNFWKSEGFKSPSKFFQSITGLSDTAFHAVKWTAEHIHIPAISAPGTAIEHMSSMDVSASTWYELRKLRDSDIPAVWAFVDAKGPNQKLMREISTVAADMYAKDKGFSLYDSVTEYINTPAYDRGGAGIKNWEEYKKSIGYTPSEKPAKSKDAKPAVTTTPETEEDVKAAAMRINVYTVIAGQSEYPIGTCAAGTFVDAMKEAGYSRIYTGNPDLYRNASADNRYPYVVVTWTERDAESVREELLNGPVTNGDTKMIVRISRYTDAEILAALPTLSTDDVVHKLCEIH